MEYLGFLHDKKTMSAVVRQFEVIGEAAKNIPESIRRNYVTVHPRQIWDAD